jgi:hypothetical protein
VRAAPGLDGLYVSFDWADGSHSACPRPHAQKYQVCTGWLRDDIGNIRADTLVNGVWMEAPMFDQRCTVWGGPFSAEYLGCLAAIPPKLS